jgi:cell division protein FtsW
MSELDFLVDAAQQPVEPTPASEVVDNITQQSPATEPKAKTKKASAKSSDEPRPKADRYILAMYIALCVISVVELYSASSREVASGNIIGPLGRHCLMLLGGFVLCMWISRWKIKWFIPAAPVFSVISVALMVYVLFCGATINGARRSFSLMGIPIQPAEFLKLATVLIIAYIMSRNQEKGGVKTKGVVQCAIVVSLFGGLLFTQGLTNTILLMGISIAMMLVGGIQWKKFLVVMIFYGLVGVGGLYYKSHSEQYSEAETQHIVETGTDFSGKKVTINRSSTWKNRLNRYSSDKPLYEQDITAENRQEMYAYMAQANGGLIGVFPGNSRETARLPLAFSDYIFSIVVEDLGFIGGMFLLLIYLSLLGRAGALAARCDRAYPALLVMGMAVMISCQALFHMAIVTGVFPVSGQPLPMISKGGTSILITSIAFGIMLSVSRYVAATRAKSKRQSLDLPSELAAANPTQLSK